jgi:rfaE bifunctional protein kinase chain/domain/rfaE bifunctional protein nucleotidyltransferase chain/domain
MNSKSKISSIAPSDKLLAMSDLSKVIQKAKEDGNTIVLCHGVFDIVHPGHIKHLGKASEQGAILIVTLTPDGFVNKGVGRPVFTSQLRAENIAALAFVDYVAINEWPTAIETIKLLMPNIYVKGIEYADSKSDLTGNIIDELEAVDQVGGEVFYTEEITFSSSNIINNHIDIFSPETEEWVKVIRKKYSAQNVIDYFDNVSELKVLVLGEVIVDEYVFCDGLGKSSKDPILAFRYDNMQSYAGGSLAIANHLAGMTNHVGLVSFIGNPDTPKQFGKKWLAPSIKHHLILQEEEPTIHKRRFIDLNSGSKLFELYIIGNSKITDKDEVRFIQTLDQVIGDYDVVIVADYGHGMMSPTTVDLVAEKSKFLVVNTQVNAGNRGFNTISKYPRADYVSITGNELELEFRSRSMTIPEMVEQLSTRIDCSHFTVTMGKEGSIHYNANTGFVEAPAFAVRVIDRVGAGDAVLAVSSLLAATDAPEEILGLVSNLVGAQMVAKLGNQHSIDRDTLAKHITTLLN